MTNKRLQIVGGGKMGEALLGGLLANRWAKAEELAVVEPDALRRLVLEETFPSLSVLTEPQRGVDTVIAVKPQYVVEVCRTLADCRVVSIAAGVTIATMQDALPPGTPVIRVMPNTPALVGEGAAGLAGGTTASPDDIAWAMSILSGVGIVHQVSEAGLDAVTGVSGSGPAYVFLLAEAMIAAAQEQGLARDIAVSLVQQTLYGAATLLRSSGEDAATLRENVTSPNGTTAAGLAVFEAAGFRATVSKVVEAATNRSRELGAET